MAGRQTFWHGSSCIQAAAFHLYLSRRIPLELRRADICPLCCHWGKERTFVHRLLHAARRHAIVVKIRRLCIRSNVQQLLHIFRKEILAAQSIDTAFEFCPAAKLLHHSADLQREVAASCPITVLPVCNHNRSRRRTGVIQRLFRKGTQDIQRHNPRFSPVFAQAVHALLRRLIRGPQKH